MMSFLKSFLTNDKTAEEKALMSGIEKQRDVIVIDGYEGMPEEQPQSCGTPKKSGCGGCGCG